MKKVRLSSRLERIASMVKDNAVLADIGTDHGFIPVKLVDEGRIQKAIACDLRSGPLERARAHIREYGLENQIETRLSDGLCEIVAGEVDTVLIAGMGGTHCSNTRRKKRLKRGHKGVYFITTFGVVTCSQILVGKWIFHCGRGNAL